MKEIPETSACALGLQNPRCEFREFSQYLDPRFIECPWLAVYHAKGSERESVVGCQRKPRVEADEGLSCDQGIVGKSRVEMSVLDE